jgi:Helicase conserved C-terminal domain
MSEALRNTAGGPGGGAEGAPARLPLDAYRSALGQYDLARLGAIAHAAGMASASVSPRVLALAVAENLGEPKQAARQVGRLPHGPRLALGLFTLTESAAWPIEGLFHALACLGVEPRPAVRGLIDAGLVAAELREGMVRNDLDRRIDDDEPRGIVLRVHPAAMAAARTVLPDTGDAPLPRAGPARQEREADGLEPILRIAVVWQRVADAPLRQTQQGTLYKRDRERLEDDSAVAGPIADALEPLPDMPALWLSLAQRVGLLRSDPVTERVTAAAPEVWSDNVYHLPQMVAARWLGLWTWHEQGGMQHEGAEVRLALPFVRVAVLLWLATLGEGEWVALDDLAAALSARSPRWDRPAFQGQPDLEPGDAAWPRTRNLARGRGKKAKTTGPVNSGHSALEAMLLGAAYQFGLVRAAEEVPSGRRLVQLTPLGRYLLALGPPPAPRETYEHFLFVQPNFEIIAYRQGLTPALVGRFSRFATWSQVGAALALRITAGSVYLGLEGGMTPQAMRDLLQRHSPRPLPAGVAEALRTWSGRRDRVTYHAAATLVEFGSADDLEEALRAWPQDCGPAPVHVSDRMLLVEDERGIPFQRLRLTGSRDYRRPPEVCVEVEADGVSLTLDPARSDLLVDAELASFADEQTEVSRGTTAGSLRRRFVVTRASLARADETGMTEPTLATWFPRRTGTEIPPAIRLLLLAAGPRVAALTAGRPLVVRTPNAEILDGLVQHPETRDLLGERLGPTAVAISAGALPAFRLAVARLGIPLHDDPS